MRACNRVPVAGPWTSGPTALVVALTVFATAACAHAQNTTYRPQGEEPAGQSGALDPLNDAELAAAERLARDDARVREVLGAGRIFVGTVRHRVVKPAREVPAAGSPDVGRAATVLLYNPDTHRGARAIVDLREEAVTEVAAVPSEDVPSGEEELAAAWEIARTTLAVREVLGSSVERYRPLASPDVGDEVDLEVQALPVRHAAGGPCAEGRCLSLLFRRGDQYLTGVEVVVDVRSRTVEVTDHRDEEVQP